MREGAGCSRALRLFQNFLYKCVGTTLGAAASKEVVRERLQELLGAARFQQEAEHEVGQGAASGSCGCVCPFLSAPQRAPSHAQQRAGLASMPRPGHR